MSTRLKENSSLLFIFCVVATAGCTRPASNFAPPIQAVSSARKPVSQTTVALSPLYLQAEALCKRKRFQQAADSLLRLSRTPDLSPDDRAYCLQQRELCLSHLTGPKLQTAFNSISTPARAASNSDCGPLALLSVSQKYGMKASLAELRAAGGTTSEKGTSMQGMTRAALKAGWKSEGVQANREALPDLPLPAIAWADGNHYLAVLEMRGRGESGTALIQDPSKSGTETISQEKLLQRCGGYLLLLKR